MKTSILFALFFASTAIAAPVKRSAWEARVGAKLTPAMRANVITVTPGSCDKISAALRQLPAAGGTVQLTAGLYDCANPIELGRDNLRLVGAGRDATVLRLTDWTSKPVIVIGVMEARPETVILFPGEHSTVQYYPVRQVKNVIVENLMVDGNRHNQYTEFLGKDFYECYDQDANVGGKCDMKPEGPAKFIRNNGVTIRGADNVTVRNVRADRALSGGLVTEKRCSGLLVDGFTSKDSVFDGIAGYETKHSMFRNFRIEEHMFSGISLDFGFNENVFEKGELLNNKDNGVFTVANWQVAFRKMIVRGNGNFGMFVDGRNYGGKYSEGTCDGHVFSDSIIEDNKSAPLRFNSPCKGVVIERSKLSRTGNNECVAKAPGAEISVVDTDECTAN